MKHVKELLLVSGMSAAATTALQRLQGVSKARTPFFTICLATAFVCPPVTLAAEAGQAEDSSSWSNEAIFPGSVWIGPAGQGEKAAQVNTYFAFCKQLVLADKPVSAPVRVTADARYILWVNGEFVGRGPARGFPWAQPYDEFDLARFLKPGTNWIAVVVHYFGKPNGVATVTGKTALLLGGHARLPSGRQVPLNTDATWQVRPATWYCSAPTGTTVRSDDPWFGSVAASFLHGCFAFQERYDGRLEPSGWRRGQGRDDWKTATAVAAPGDAPWSGFEPRGLNPMRETLVQVKGPVVAGTGACATGFLESESLDKTWKAEAWNPLQPAPVPDTEGWITVSPPDGGFTALTFDLGWNPAAFARIEVRGAAGGEILDSGYECSLGKNGGPEVWNDACDRFFAAAGDSAWESFLLRGYRFHTVKVRAPHPVKLRVLARVAHHDVGTPLAFACSDPGLSKAWEVTDRTLRAGMLDAFVDNNWREQTQWLHDGCVGALGAWATYGDTSLWRRLLRQTGQSSQQFSDGAVNSMPACDSGFQRQWMPITDYSLVWVASLDQHYAMTADAALIREMMPYLRGVILRFVESGFTAERLFVHPTGATAFLDWTAVPWDKRPYNLTMNLVVLRALRAAANLAAVTGDAELLDYCRRRDRELTEAITGRFWSEEHRGWHENVEPSAEAKQFIASTKAGRTDDPWLKIQISMSGNRRPTVCTRHGNSLAVLLKLGTPEQQAAAVDLVVRAFEPSNPHNNGMSPLWTDKILGALFEGGRDADAVRLLQESYGAWAANGALHWGEGFGPGDAAQTCGSSVNWLLTSYILGIRPTKPGFAEAVFDPRPGTLTWAKGVVPTPRGNIKVEWKRDPDGRITIVNLDAPKGIIVQNRNRK